MSAKFKAGDLISATRGDTEIRGRLWLDGTGELVIDGIGSTAIADLRRRGFTVTLELSLPTEPGFYLDPDGDAWVLTTAGEMVILTNGGVPSAATTPFVTNYAPFTRLEPRAETARAVLEALDRVAIPIGFGDDDHREIRNTSWDRIAAEFGVILDGES